MGSQVRFWPDALQNTSSNSARVGNFWKVNFCEQRTEGTLAVWRDPFTCLRAPTMFNLRMDPYERGMEEGGGAIDFLARNMWLIVPVQGKIKEFFSDFDQFPYQEGSSLNASGINYGLLRQQAALKRLNELERMKPR